MAAEKRNYSLYYLKHPIDREIRYVGITNDPERRYRNHRSASKKNKYRHYPVYRWWRKLAKQGLEPQMEILKTGLTKKEAEQAEIETIALYRKLSNRLLNITDGGNLTINSKHYEFIDPSGNHVKISNLAKFCKENNLDQSAMCAVHAGRRKSCKGYTNSLENRKKMLKRQNRIYEFIDSSGNHVKTHNLHKFCKENGLCYNYMRCVHSGKMGFYKGWTTSLENREEMFKRQNKIFEFIDPSGNHVKTHNLAKFCRENGLSHSGMHRVHNGKLNSYKGWTAANNMRID